MIKRPVYGELEIEDVLSKARSRNKEIGVYVSHVLSEEDYYTVNLTNGKILLFTAEIKDRHKLLSDRINDVAARFQSSKKI
jgi:hypothetical protein